MGASRIMESHPRRHPEHSLALLNTFQCWRLHSLWKLCSLLENCSLLTKATSHAVSLRWSHLLLPSCFVQIKLLPPLGDSNSKMCQRSPGLLCHSPSALLVTLPPPQSIFLSRSVSTNTSLLCGCWGAGLGRWQQTKPA